MFDPVRRGKRGGVGIDVWRDVRSDDLRDEKGQTHISTHDAGPPVLIQGVLRRVRVLRPYEIATLVLQGVQVRELGENESHTLDDAHDGVRGVRLPGERGRVDVDVVRHGDPRTRDALVESDSEPTCLGLKRFDVAFEGVIVAQNAEHVVGGADRRVAGERDLGVGGEDVDAGG